MHIATNLSKFFDVVRKVISEWEGSTNEYIDPWFRGQHNADQELIPSLYRYGDEIDEDDFRDEFAFKAFPYLHQMRAQDPWEMYALMQHYGLPTRLLDWSEAALVALYFAVSADSPSNDAGVWMLNPWSFNKATLNTRWILDTSYKVVRR